jgi:hypothetical protein
VTKFDAQWKSPRTTTFAPAAAGVLTHSTAALHSRLPHDLNRTLIGRA